jgi:hypothetical protein
MEFLKRYWRGEVPLRKVFWGGFIIGGCLLVPIILFKHSGIRKLIIIEKSVHIAFLIGWSVGLWSSAKAYAGRRIFKILAKAYAVLVWTGIAVGIFFIFLKWV